MTTKTALITGTSRPVELGFAAARQLAELGYHVILAAPTSPARSRWPSSCARTGTRQPPCAWT
ncbi:hypothetical protein ABT072_45175 [Streptomyces sp. NPDC002589]|uniref:hypothetical protein n=1 Tax=Streptomyces sp. NPDC002589 TaxID=3154420 RepID=UPI00332BE40C